MVRIKVKCRNPTKIPKKRLMELNDDLYVVSFKTECFTQVSEKIEKDDGDDGGDDSDDVSLLGEEDKEKDLGSGSPTAKSPEPEPQDQNIIGNLEKNDKQSKPSGSKIVRNLS